MQAKLAAILLALNLLDSTGGRAVAQEPAVPASSPAAAADTPHQSLNILAAAYVYGSQRADVTERVKELLRKDQTFSANPKWLRTDPHPGMNKALVIFCEVQGKSAVFSAGEDEDVSRALLLKNARPVEVNTETAIDLEVTGQDIGDSQKAMIADEDAFPRIETPTDDQGRPIIQTVRLNERVVEMDGKRYSGFRFVVDRAPAAEKQKVADKESLQLFWFFVTPPSLSEWYIAPVKGTCAASMGSSP